jgi:hypothetical protein
MTTETIEHSRVQSILSEQLHIFVDEQGVRRAAIKGYIYDYTTFCTMLLWAMGGSVAYLNIMSENGNVATLKQLNAQDPKLIEKDNYRSAKYLYSKFGEVARQYTKEQLAEIYLAALVQS